MSQTTTPLAHCAVIPPILEKSKVMVCLVCVREIHVLCWVVKYKNLQTGASAILKGTRGQGEGISSAYR